MIYAFEGHAPQCHADTWVAPDANLIGKVVLEAGASVWFGCDAARRQRGDPRGRRVERAGKLRLPYRHGLSADHGQGCTIGHKVMLHGCTIGDGSLIGMGATILNGARIGSGCLIGAGALIPEGREIPDGSLVMGMPGKVVRELDATAKAGLLASAAHYQDRMRRFRAGLTPIS
jgi:carbonic anhydrase/acetyltransferase-like protein (isoleucine patch superfamily)